MNPGLNIMLGIDTLYALGNLECWEEYGKSQLTLFLLRSRLFRFDKSAKIHDGIVDIRFRCSDIMVKFESPANSSSLSSIILLFVRCISIMLGNQWKILLLRKSTLLSVNKKMIKCSHITVKPVLGDHRVFLSGRATCTTGDGWWKHDYKARLEPLYNRLPDLKDHPINATISKFQG